MNEVFWSEGPTLFDVNFKKLRARMETYRSIVSVVQTALSPSLLKKEYLDENAKNPMFGHCYVASEAIFHLLPKCKLQPYYGKDKRNITHWWLVDERHDIRIDATADQYYSQGLEPPYEAGVRASFLTNDPSKRCRKVMQHVLEWKGYQYASV